MNPIAAIEKLINEHGSAAILRERLELASDQFAALDKQNVALNTQLTQAISQNDVLMSENLALKQEIQDLRSQIGSNEDRKDRLAKECEEILFFFFETDQKFTIQHVAQHFSLHPSVAKAHFDTLRDKRFVWAPTRVITSFETPPPASYSITAAGREYAMRYRNKNG